MKVGKVVFCLFLSFSISTSVLSSVQAEQLARASGETLSSAVGHFARARSLLIEAIREFDRGQKLADPSALLDPKRWRNTLIDRSHELEKVLDPQPKVSKSGIKFNADKRLLNEAKD